MPVSIGDLSVLGEYQRLHRQDWQQTVQFSDSLIRVSGQSLPPLAAARDAGLVGLDLVPGAKRWFARKAMGTGGRKPVISAAESLQESNTMTLMPQHSNSISWSSVAAWSAPHWPWACPAKAGRWV